MINPKFGKLLYLTLLALPVQASNPSLPDTASRPRVKNTANHTGSPLSHNFKTPVPRISLKPQEQGKKHHYLDTPPCLAWINPDMEPKAALLCVHGLGLHNGTYKDFGERMSSLGFAVYAVDVRGFGSFQGAVGRQQVDFDACLEDVYKTLKVIHKVYPQLPVFLLGESMGGAIALRITSLHPELIDGLISSVPAGDRFKQTQTALKIGLRLLTAPNKEFNIGTSVVNQATQKPELKEQWSKDPLARMNLSPRELIQFQSFMNDNHESVRKIANTPVLMIQGCKDKLVKPQGTVSLFNKITCKDKDMVLIDNAEHLIFEEGQFDNHVIEITNTWLNSHLHKPNGLNEVSTSTAGKEIKP